MFPEPSAEILCTANLVDRVVFLTGSQHIDVPGLWCILC
jgi:hypothetical protein